MGGGGGGGTNTSVVKTVPPWAEPYVRDYAETAYNLWQADTLSVYPGTIVATQPTDELEGISGLATRGRYGDQVITKAIAYLDDAINDGHLLGLKTKFQGMLADVSDKTDASFASVSSRIGRKPYYVDDPDSTLLAQVLAAAFPGIWNSRTEALLYAENYLQERNLQDYALAYGVEMGKHAAIDAETLRRAGLYQREYVQSSYEITHKRFTEQQELAVANLEIFGNAIRALTGSQESTSMTDPTTNKFMATVGGVVMGGAAGWIIGSEIGWIGGPWGAFLGAVAGGLYGYFSS